MTSLGTLFDRFQGFFSKSFFITGFLPAIVFLFLNGVLIYATFPSTREPLVSSIDLSFSDKIVYGILILLLIFAFGLFISSLNPWFRQFMAGQYLPEFIKKRLTNRQRRYFEALQNEKKALRPILFQYRKVTRNPGDWEQKLIAARQKGVNEPAKPIPRDLKQKYDQLENLRKKGEDIPFSEINNLFSRLEKELAANQAVRDSQLDQMHVGFLDLLDYGSKRTEVTFKLVSAELSARFPQDTGRIAVTQLANLAEVYREYSLLRYGLDTEKYWLQILKFIKQDTNFYPILDDAKTQLDFSVAITAVFAVTSLIWLPLTALFASTIYPYLVVAGIALPLIVIFYLVIIQNYHTFTEAAQSAIDLYHLDLIKVLHFPLPKTIGEEKILWGRVNDKDPTLVYEHEKADKKELEEAKPKPQNLWQRIIAWFRGK